MSRPGDAVRLLLFTGKGGVGKTTLAAATAARLAADGHKVLVVSTDAAHSLADALDVPLRQDPVEVDSCGLYAAQVDGRALLDGAWAALRGRLASVLALAGVDELAAEELTVLPGVEELLAIGEVYDLAHGGPWELVLVDCAPTAETLRLLALPEAAAGYLERLFPAHRRMVRGVLGGLTGSAALEHWQGAAGELSRLAERLDRLRATLTDPEATSVRLVLTPERMVLAEARRTLTALALLGVRVDGLLVNRVVPAPDRDAVGAAAEWLRGRRGEQDAVLAQLRADAAGLPVRTVPYLAAEPVGLPALLDLGAKLDPLPEPGAGAPHRDLLSVRRVAGSGRDLDAEFELLLSLPLLAGPAGPAVATPAAAAQAVPPAPVVSGVGPEVRAWPVAGGVGPGEPAGPAVELARVGDELAVTVDGRRRLIGLPSVLRRCQAVDARQHDDGLTVRFRPDPDLWLLR